MLYDIIQSAVVSRGLRPSTAAAYIVIHCLIDDVITIQLEAWIFQWDGHTRACTMLQLKSAKWTINDKGKPVSLQFLTRHFAFNLSKQLVTNWKY